MSHNHKLDRDKVQKLLLERGWKRGPNDEWVLPLGMTFNQFQIDWEECLLEGVVCPHEEGIAYTKEFLKKYPTQRRT